MQIDPASQSFIDASIEHYREVTLAVQSFEEQVESVLRSIWSDFKEQLAAVGIRDEDAVFKKDCSEDASVMYLRRGLANISIGTCLSCSDADSDGGSERFSAYSFIWVQDRDLRRSLDDHIAAHVSAPIVHEYADSTTYVTRYFDLKTSSCAIETLHDSCRVLFECLFASRQFCKAFNIAEVAQLKKTGRPKMSTGTPL